MKELQEASQCISSAIVGMKHTSGSEEDQLWVEKYKPKDFFDLLSDDVCSSFFDILHPFLLFFLVSVVDLFISAREPID